MKKIGYYTLGIISFFAFLYGCCWLATTGSYWLFYEDMVRDTITEMVKSVALK
jgi:hypothetical protein